MISRREFLKRSFFIGAGAMMPGMVKPLGPLSRLPRSPLGPDVPKPAYSTPSLNPLDVPKFAENLVIPPAMPGKTEIMDADGKTVDYYEIGVRQFQQQVLPSSLPQTTVWGYGPASNAENTLTAFNYPSFTIEATANKPVRVRWKNQLYRTVTKTVNNKPVVVKSFLPHLLPVDPTLHWANPAGPETDMMPMFESTPGPYRGPVPMVPHVHGAHVGPESDGYAEAWWLPDADDIPAGYHRQGSWYGKNQALFERKHGSGNQAAWTADSAVFQYPNDQRAGTIWYHDHTVGMTRLNVYAGPAGFYIIRDSGPDGQPVTGTLPSDPDPANPKYEIPIVIQDRSFNLDVANNQAPLFYPDSRAFFDGFDGPYIPTSDIHPIWNPEFFGNCIVVNGKTWPKLDVERRRYRIRFLNGCNARTLILKMVENANAARPAAPTLPFWVIGTEGGFLPDHAAEVNGPDGLLMMPAERYDVIIDFSKAAPGVSDLYLINEAPDEPYGGAPVDDSSAANKATTGLIMKFHLGPIVGSDPSSDPAVPGALVLPPLPGTADAKFIAPSTRQVSLNEMESAELTNPVVGPLEALLGTVGTTALGAPIGKANHWVDSVTEVVTPGTTEEWEIYNFTVDAHPIHLHQVMFQVINREVFDPAVWTYPPPSVSPLEAGYKDTVVSLPGTITRIRARFNLPGRYVWHCHIVEHEDNEMMRPYDVAHVYRFPLIGK